MDTGMNMQKALSAKEYNRENAVAYAKRWALSRNPLFIDFAGVGGDCTNFVSQAVLAGSCEMNDTPTFGWYIRSANDRAPAWSGVNEFFDFMTGSGDFPPALSRVGPFGYVTTREFAREGDVIQLANNEGRFYHTLMITGISPEGDILVSAHTNDALDRPLSSYRYASERVIHIMGVLVPEGETQKSCFDTLISGEG